MGWFPTRSMCVGPEGEPLLPTYRKAVSHGLGVLNPHGFMMPVVWSSSSGQGWLHHVSFETRTLCVCVLGGGGGGSGEGSRATYMGMTRGPSSRG